MGWFKSVKSTDVYDIEAFYVRSVETRKAATDKFQLWVTLADSTPSRGMSRYHDLNYDTKHLVSYVGKTEFTSAEAADVARIIDRRRTLAHADL